MKGRGALPHEIRRSTRAAGSSAARSPRAGAHDSLAALAALDLVQPSDVLVIASQGFSGTATFDDNMARVAETRARSAS